MNTLWTFLQKQARRIYEILRLRITETNNEHEYRNYRLEIKKRLNIPYKREQHDQAKLDRVLKNMDKPSSISAHANEQRIQTLDKEYKLLEEDYLKVVKRLENASEL